MKPDPTRNTRAALIDIVAAHQLKRADIATLLGMPVRKYSNGTVDAWLSGRRNMPAMKLAYLRVKLSRAPA